VNVSTWIATLVVGGSLTVATCGGNGPKPAAAETATTFPQASATLAPRTQIPDPTKERAALESLIAALRSGAIEAIRPYIGHKTVGCSEQMSPSIPACKSGERSGTLTPVFYFSNCNGGYLEPAQVQGPLQRMAAMTLSTYVYRLPQQAQSSDQFSLILIDSSPENAGKAWEAIVDEGHIVGLIYSCALTPEELVAARHYTEAVVLPAP
jgi:hypothetical protein